MLLLLLACTGDSGNLNKGEPVFEWEPASINFGEVVVTDYLDVDVAMRNTGYGTLEFTSIAMADLSSTAFTVMAYPEAGLGHNEEGVMTLRYSPTAEQQDLAILQLATTDEKNLEVEIPLEGIGVKPCVDVDPETLDFGHIDAGGTYSLPVQVCAACSGTLEVQGFTFPGAESLAYAVALPEGWETPKQIEAGDCTQFEVAFSPLTADEYSGELWVQTNDPEEPYAVVRLRGNMADSTVNQAPIVEVTDPNNGQYFLDNENVALNGHVVDDEPVTGLYCVWYADNGTDGNQALIGGSPDAKGNVAMTSHLPAGDLAVTLYCIDGEGAAGEDTADVLVWPAEGPFVYTISGGDSILDYFVVDDDLEIYLNNTLIYSDNDGGSTTLPPIEFEASIGDELRIVVEDDHASEAIVDALYLHFGPGVVQPLNTRVCLSNSGAHECFSEDYNWTEYPHTFFDETYTIAIP